MVTKLLRQLLWLPHIFSLRNSITPVAMWEVGSYKSLFMVETVILILQVCVWREECQGKQESGEVTHSITVIWGRVVRHSGRGALCNSHTHIGLPASSSWLLCPRSSSLQMHMGIRRQGLRHLGSCHSHGKPETRMESPAPGFGLVQPWPLMTFAIDGQSLSFSVPGSFK